ncbi:MAG: hypothetical protein EA422_13525 [Gemmatimonadales bacterium]|nr:MAG: hypothetical protein EA422_13525 [Gemmatimonadales bacterium]
MKIRHSTTEALSTFEYCSLSGKNSNLGRHGGREIRYFSGHEPIRPIHPIRSIRSIARLESYSSPRASTCTPKGPRECTPRK